MRTVFGILFIILALVSLPNVVKIMTDVWATIGALMGWGLATVLPVYLLLRKSGSSEEEKKRDSGSDASADK